MTRTLSVVLLVIGVVLIVYGINASHSVGSDVSRAVNGTPTDKTIWLLVGGIAAGLIGLFGLLGGGKSK